MITCGYICISAKRLRMLLKTVGSHRCACYDMAAHSCAINAQCARVVAHVSNVRVLWCSLGEKKWCSCSMVCDRSCHCIALYFNISSVIEIRLISIFHDSKRTVLTFRVFKISSVY